MKESKSGAARAKARVSGELRRKALSRIKPERRKLYLVTGRRFPHRPQIKKGAGRFPHRQPKTIFYYIIYTWNL